MNTEPINIAQQLLEKHNLKKPKNEFLKFGFTE